MKNFKLLLATTAILSTGALMVKATDSIPGDSASIGVEAELVEIRAIKTVSDLSFGRVAYMEYTGETDIQFIGIEIDENGTTKVDEIGTDWEKADVETYVLTPGTQGIVKGATCSELDYPGKEDSGQASISMDTMPTGAEIAEVSYLHCKTVGNTSVFYGLFFTESKTGGIVPGTYSGSFTVTLIANEG